MKTRIIQPEPEPPPATEAAPPEAGDPEARLRRTVVAVAVIGYFALGIVHPAPDPEVGDDATLFYWLHVVQPLLIALVAWSIWLLVKDLPGRAARVARGAIIPYAIAYTTLDAVVGIAKALVIRQANEMSAADAAVVQRVLDGDAYDGDELMGVVIYLASGLTWFVMALAAAIAVKQIGGRGPTLLMALGAAIFAVGHPFPPGPIGIALFGAGVVWLELRRETAKAPETQAVLAP